MSRWLVLLVCVIALACSGGEEPKSGADAPAAQAAQPAQPAAPAVPAPAGSGFELTHLTEGSGPSPGPTDVVVVHYHGTFPDGQVFDSSVQRGEPAKFPLNRVIPCWTQGVAQMKVGGKAKLVCHPDVAYGERGAPPRIPPNATLNFEVELIAIEAPAAPQ
jgi:FKBP-type peptidyl-prolyl cis-trans isomerase FkpA